MKYWKAVLGIAILVLALILMLMKQRVEQAQQVSAPAAEGVAAPTEELVAGYQAPANAIPPLDEIAQQIMAKDEIRRIDAQTRIEIEEARAKRDARRQATTPQNPPAPEVSVGGTETLPEKKEVAIPTRQQIKYKQSQGVIVY